MPSSLHPLTCPLCGHPNQCAVAAGLPAESCWCMQARIAPQVLEQVPAPLRAQVCLCPACSQAGLSPTPSPD